MILAQRRAAEAATAVQAAEERAAAAGGARLKRIADAEAEEYAKKDRCSCCLHT